MEFRIADTFTDSLARLAAEEQKAAKTTAFDLQVNPAQPGLQFHKLDKAKDPNFWSVRVSRDLRIIVHRTSNAILLCYVHHHDEAYRWAEKRRLETHPKTGAAQLVEIRERVEEIAIPRYVEHAKPVALRPPLFDHLPAEQLLGYGVPPEWITTVQQTTEDGLLDVASHLPAEAAEALLELATGVEPHAAGVADSFQDSGGMPSVLPPMAAAPAQHEPILGAPVIGSVAGSVLFKLTTRSTPRNPFEHPDALRRFRRITSVEELALALDYPWERWAVFLHPEQKKLVERDFAGPAKVAGTAGTGKTIVAIHRAAHLARANREARVLLTTFSEPLANALRAKLRLLLSSEPRLADQIEVHSMDVIGLRLYELNVHKAKLATTAEIDKLIQRASEGAGEHKFSQRFLVTEWEQVVDAWQLDSWEEYRDVQRLGRRTRLKESQRKLLWTIFEGVRSALREAGAITSSGMFNVLARHYRAGAPAPYDHCVVDEAQDISIAQLRFLAAVGGSRPNGLFFAGDLGQRIFQQPFSWKAAGVDVRGRSTTLKINYRTSHQIRSQADRLLEGQVQDVDGNVEDRKGTISLFDGPKPDIKTFSAEADEIACVRDWLNGLTAAGLRPHDVALFVRSAGQLQRPSAAVAATGLAPRVLDEHIEIVPGKVSIGTMHLAKGLEFRAVGVMACDDEVIPLQERIETVTDDGDLEDVYNTERQLLYVACTRARDHLLVTGTEPASEFLDDLSR